MIDFRIEEMTIEHLDDVVAIERAVFLNPWTYDMYKAEVLKDYSHHYVVMSDGKVIAFFGFFNTDIHEAEVTNIAVSPDYQGNGLGNKIITYMLNKAKEMNIHKIFLETRDGNFRARSLYEKFGFSLINKRKKYYDGVEDACIYMWEDNN